MACGGEGGAADAGRSPEACPASCRLARPEDPGGRGAPCGEPRPTTHGRRRPQGWPKRPLLAHLPESPACQAASRGGASARGGCLFPHVCPASLPHKLKHTSVPRAPPDSFHVGLTSDSKVSPSRASREQSHRLTHPSQPGPGLSSPPEALLRPVVPPPACSRLGPVGPLLENRVDGTSRAWPLRPLLLGRRGLPSGDAPRLSTHAAASGARMKSLSGSGCDTGVQRAR